MYPYQVILSQGGSRYVTYHASFEKALSLYIEWIQRANEQVRIELLNA